mmetsp:Transcript_5393/g.11996  ORF Transcript_5393/g.11996 Transcript_5393/m.11996 type:complete len:137 (+) Transcript_5393:7228-7638(+)
MVSLLFYGNLNTTRSEYAQACNESSRRLLSLCCFWTAGKDLRGVPNGIVLCFACHSHLRIEMKIHVLLFYEKLKGANGVPRWENLQTVTATCRLAVLSSLRWKGSLCYLFYRVYCYEQLNTNASDITEYSPLFRDK